MTSRERLTVSGQVQGVGFRPFIWRLAQSLGLSGFCLNTSAGVVIEAQGEKEALDKFTATLLADPPPLARIAKISREPLPPITHENDFAIRESQGHAGQQILVAPDVAICADCIADIREKSNRRHQYAFTNCVNCGPRYSITGNLPYDRPQTAMKCFVMCADCDREYHDPNDRRFHAQPIACHVCGPQIWLAAGKNSEFSEKSRQCLDKPLEKAADLILAGGILALKGLGGFQLACDAANDKAIQRLRALKERPDKALAVMVDSLETAKVLAKPDEIGEKLLTGAEKPIAFCEKKPGVALSSRLAPDSLFLGIMLPYTPLHILLFDELKKKGMSNPCLVMTSGNARGEPICLGNREALAKLGGFCDAFLLHNRDILVRVDDSVISVAKSPYAEIALKEKPLPFRRARGYVPTPAPSPFHAEESVLGTGAELKATFSLSRRTEIFTSQHIGDLSCKGCMDFYEEALRHLSRLLEVSPALIIHDAHPDFISSQYARELAEQLDVPCHALQHHAAHAAAVLGENGVTDKALAVCLDGSGLGLDGSIWGGEFLLCELGAAKWRRVGSFEQFPLSGAEKAVLEPWRISRALDPGWHPGKTIATERELHFLDEIVAKKINSPPTSSCGRLFDAVAARLGICAKITYEGQAAIRLEKEARLWLGQNSMGKLPIFKLNAKNLNNLALLPALELFRATANIFEKKGDAGLAAAAFHYNLALLIAEMAMDLAGAHNVRQIGFSGGVMQNMTLAAPLLDAVSKNGFTALTHTLLPPGDACVSYGQAVWGQALLRNGKINCRQSG